MIIVTLSLLFPPSCAPAYDDGEIRDRPQVRWLSAFAIARRQAGQTQSSAEPAAGIGSRTGSAAHQQPPPRLQSNAAPQRPQVRRLRAGLARGCSIVLAPRYAAQMPRL
jgi:hypothetical protein